MGIDTGDSKVLCGDLNNNMYFNLLGLSAWRTNLYIVIFYLLKMGSKKSGIFNNLIQGKCTKALIQVFSEFRPNMSELVMQNLYSNFQFINSS